MRLRLNLWSTSGHLQFKAMHGFGYKLTPLSSPKTLSLPDEMHSATWRLEIPNVELSPIYKILQPLTEGPSLGINEISANIDKKTKFSTKLCLTKIWYTSV
jgi:hypothetical protein